MKQIAMREVLKQKRCSEGIQWTLILNNLQEGVSQLEKEETIQKIMKDTECGRQEAEEIYRDELYEQLYEIERDKRQTAA